jgi:hypothetical protein
VRAAVARVALRQYFQLDDQRLGCVTQTKVGADEVGVVIREMRGRRIDPPVGAKVEEHGPATEKRLVIAINARREKRTQLRQQLALAARPFEDGCGGSRTGQTAASIARAPCS